MKNDVKLSEEIELFLNYLKYERKLSNNTYESYRYNLIKINNYFNNNITYLNEDDIRNFLYKSEESAKTNAHYLTVLKTFYDYMLDLEKIKVNPSENIKSPKLEKRLPKFLTVWMICLIILTVSIRRGY